MCLGAVLRLFPIWFGLPYLGARPDEETAVAHALAILGGDLNPHFFHWPSLTFYAFAALYGAASGIRRALSLDPVLTGADRLLIARGFVALAGTLTIVVLFRLGAPGGRRRRPGFWPRRFLAVAILHVRDSHFAMTDVLMTLLVTVSLALLLRAGGRGPGRAASGGRDSAGSPPQVWRAASRRRRSTARRPIIAAMGAAQLVCLVSSMKDARRLRAWTPSMAFLAAFAAGFVAATPYALLDFETFATDLRFDFTHLSDRTRRQPRPRLVVSPDALAAVRRWPVDLRRRDSRRRAVREALHAPRASSSAPSRPRSSSSIGSGYTVFFRYILPLVPIVCLLAAVGVRHGGPWLASRAGLSNRATVALLAVLVGGPALVHSAWLDVLLARTDTRVLAARWLAPRLQAEESLHQAAALVRRAGPVGASGFMTGSSMPATGSFGDPEGRTPDWLVLLQSPLSTYARVPAELRPLVAEQVHARPHDSQRHADARGRPSTTCRTRSSCRSRGFEHGRASGADRSSSTGAAMRRQSRS